MSKNGSASRSRRTAASALLSMLGLLALTACASTPAAPEYVALRATIPEVVMERCPRTARPETPAPGTLDVEPLTPDAAVSIDDLAAAYRVLWAAYLARGDWIVALSQFSAAQEGDVSLCEARGDLAVGVLNDLNDAGDALRDRQH